MLYWKKKILMKVIRDYFVLGISVWLTVWFVLILVPYFMLSRSEMLKVVEIFPSLLLITLGVTFLYMFCRGFEHFKDRVSEEINRH